MKVPETKCETCKHFKGFSCAVLNYIFENGHEMLSISKNCSHYKKKDNR